MTLYRVTTPATPRTPGFKFADFERATECTSTTCVGRLLARHGFVGCTVHRRRRGRHWVLEFDSSMATDSIACAAMWLRVEDAQ